MNLHPSLQKTLIDVFNDDRFADFQYFFTTHSNHFLDLTLDVENISIYTFKKETKGEKSIFKVENVHSKSLKPLELLGVRNSSIFLSNCTIWVEGITDRLYIRQFLKVYQEYLYKKDKSKIFKESLHYSFIEYGENNITHWSFLDKEELPIEYKSISQNIFLIADSDGGNKNERHDALKRKLDNNFGKLEVREIENALSWDTIKKVIAEYEKIDINNSNFKNKNITEKTYKNEKIGEFIEENLENRRRKGSYKTESGTITNKVEFCKKAIKHIKTYEDLSSEAKNLVEKIYDFISSNNK